MNLNESEIKDAVIVQAVAQLAETFRTNEDIADEIKLRSVEIIKDQVNQRIDTILKDKLESFDFPDTNNFGEPKGPTRTMREFIDAEVKNHLQQEVDYQGKPKTERYGNGEPRLNFLTKEATNRAIDEMVKSAAVAIRSQIGTILGNEVKTKIDQTLKALNHSN